MAAPDPVDIRLLSLVAESGKAAVHDIAARMGMDPREVASRLVALSATGLPLIVGVECDPYGLRNAIASAGAYLNYQQQQQQQRGFAPGGPSGPYPAPQAQAQPRPPVQPPPRPDPMSTWGPPQTSSWARGDQPTRPAWTAPPSQANPVQTPAGPAMGNGQQGTVGDTLNTEGPDGEQIAIHLVEIVDPADFLFTAAGYRLREGERSVVVHTELTNRGSVPFPQLPDLYLVLVAKDGQTVGKAPVSLSSRPPHRIGVRPGETAGGHTVYVLPETTELTSIRWTARPDDERHMLTWAVES
ncbi:MAG TPA: AsnC family protein [Pseudonocardiaceae bacterium]